MIPEAMRRGGDKNLTTQCQPTTTESRPNDGKTQNPEFRET
jgi:hypothetical protein